MKLAEIKPGTVYWYETGQAWGEYLMLAYDRGPVVRADGERYDLSGTRWSGRTAQVNPKGKYVKVTPLELDGVTPYGEHPRYILGTHVRDTYENVKTRYEAAQARKAAAEEARKAAADDASAKASALRTRLDALGLSGLFTVTATQGLGWQAGLPGVKVAFAGDAYLVMDQLLTALEVTAEPGYVLTAEGNRVVQDPEWADRLANGAYER